MIKRMLTAVALLAATLTVTAPATAQAAETRAAMPSKAAAVHGKNDGKPAGAYARKGMPGAAPKASLNPAVYFYAGMKQTLATPSDGVSAIFDISNPWLSTYDYHTLVEMAVQTTDHANTVEVGINRDFLLYGDNNPHLFVYWWKNGAEQCYNGCGFVDYSGNPINVGSSVLADVGTQKLLGIQHVNNAWWIAYGSDWVGSFPDALWTGATPPVTTFTNMPFVQIFGENAAGGTIPAGQTYPNTCTDIGSTTLATATAGTKVASVTYPSRPSSEVVLISTPATITKAAWYNAALLAGTTRTFRYGGPSGC